jgi:hypothetical protein
MLFNNREERVHERICGEIESRLRKTGAPLEIRSFLLDRWSFLLAGVYFSHGDRHPDWEAGWHTVNALLWSLTPKLGQAQTERFLRLLPELLERLHSGCDAMQLEAGERDRFFAGLTLLHAAVMRAGLGNVRDHAGPFSRLGQEADRAFSDEEMARLVTESLVDEDFNRQGGEVTGIDRLRVGEGVNFQVDGVEKRLYLQWLSPMGGMYLFADRSGCDAITLTRARLSAKLASGEARLDK